MIEPTQQFEDDALATGAPNIVEPEPFDPYYAVSPEKVLDQGFYGSTSIWEATGETPTLMQTGEAFFRQENVTGSYHSRNEALRGLDPTPEEYAAWMNGDWRWDDGLDEDDMLLHPDYAHIAAQAKSEAQREAIRGILLQEIADDEVFANAGLGKNILAGLGNVVVDPTQWPLFLVPGAQGKFAARVGKSAALGFTDQTAREILLADSQMGTRTGTEQLENVGVATILTGIFGGALGRNYTPDEISRSARGMDSLIMNGEANLKDALDQNFTKEMRDKYGEDVLEWNSELGVNVKENEPIDLNNPTEVIKINPDLEAKIKADDTLDELQKEGYLIKLRRASLAVKDEKIMKATLTGLNKQGKMLLSDSPTVQLLAYAGLDTPHVGKYFDQATLGHSALTMSEVLSGKMTATFRRAYKKAIADFVKSEGGSKWAQFKATRVGNDQFNADVHRAMNMGDVHATNPIAEKLAKELRKPLNDLRDILVDAGELPENVKGTDLLSGMVDDSYLTRVYDKVAISNNGQRFVEKIREGIKQQAELDRVAINKKVDDIKADNANKLAEFEARTNARKKLTKARKAEEIAKYKLKLQNNMESKLEEYLDMIHLDSRQRPGESLEDWNRRIDTEADVVRARIMNGTSDLMPDFEMMNPKAIAELMERQAKPSFLKGRNLRVQYEFLEEFLIKDPLTAMETLARRAGGVVALKKRFGTTSFETVRQRIKNDYQALKSVAATRREANKLDDQMGDMLREAEHSWDSIAGKNPQVGDYKRKTREVAGMLKAWQIVLKLGTSGITALEDFSALFLHEGARMVLPAIRDMVARNDVHKMTKQMLHDLDTGYSLVLGEAAQNRAGLEMGTRTSQLARNANVLASDYLTAVGMNHIDYLSKQFAQYAMLSRMVRAVKKGRALHKYDRQVLRQFGMDDAMMLRVMEQMKKNGKSVDGGYDARIDMWDKQTRMDLEFTLDRAARQIISTPNIGNQPRVLKDPIWSLALQFKSHMMGTIDNHLVPMIQRNHGGSLEQKMNTMLFMTSGMLLTSMNYNVRMALSGHEADNDVGNLSREFITRTSGFGMWGSVFALGDEKFKLFERAGLAEGAPSIFMNRSVFGHVFGPVGGWVDDNITTGQGIVQFMEDGTMKRGQINAMTRIFPANNYLPLRYGVTKAKEGLHEELAP